MTTRLTVLAGCLFLSCAQGNGGLPQAGSGYGGGPSFGNTSSSDPYCGDDFIDPGEECDGYDLANETCESMGFSGGTLSCTDDCTIDTNECSTCGDGIRTGDEFCDGEDFGEETCASLGAREEGTLTCTEACQIDSTSCDHLCGNGTVEPSEHCEGLDLAGETCQSLGYDIGTLACDPTLCVFDANGCVNLACKQSGEACSTDNECCGPPQGAGSCSQICL